MTLSFHTLARRGWQCLPVAIRRDLGKAILRFLAPRAGFSPALQAGTAITVAGLLRSPTGLGEGARLCADMLRAIGYPVGLHDVSTAFKQALLPLETAASSPDKAPQAGGAIILHINPPDLPLTRLLLGRAQTREQRVIGYWAWELPQIPPAWRSGFDYVHEVWAPSTFCADAIRPFTTKPVRVVPHPVTVPCPSPRDRAGFGLPQDAFIVLSMLHFGSGFTRKNPLAGIRAFRQAFGDRSDVCLVIKITADVPLPWAEEALADAIAGANNIRILRETLSRPDQAALIQASDAVLSLHRAEGFGLVLAEAMRLGKPVVATGWSGNMEFMAAGCSAPVAYTLVPVVDPQGTYEPGQLWAEPDEADAACWLVRLRDESGTAAAMGAAAARHAETRLGSAAYVAAVKDALPPLQ